MPENAYNSSAEPLTLVKRHDILSLCEPDSESPTLQVKQVHGPSSLLPTSSPACT